MVVKKILRTCNNCGGFVSGQLYVCNWCDKPLFFTTKKYLDVNDLKELVIQRMKELDHVGKKEQLLELTLFYNQVLVSNKEEKLK